MRQLRETDPAILRCCILAATAAALRHYREQNCHQSRNDCAQTDAGRHDKVTHAGSAIKLMVKLMVIHEAADVVADRAQVL